MAESKSTRACAWCGASFVPSRPSGYKYCCVEHASRAKSKRDTARTGTPAKAEQQARWRAKHIDAVLARDNEYKARVRAERGRDRHKEYETVRAKRSIESVKRAGDGALAGIAAICCERYAHVPRLVVRVVRLVGRVDRAAMLGRETSARPRSSRGLSQHTINLRANRDRYAKDITRTRAKSYLRKTGKVMPDDGTASVAVLLGGSRCLYCDCPLTEDNRSHDHMTPLSLGGTHSAANIAPACKPCNFSKGKKSFERFVNGLDAKHRERAVAFYEKRNGPMAQMGLVFAA